MDPKCLRPDELNYELSLRQIPVADPNRLEQLQRHLNSEALGATECPTDAQRITRTTVSQEIRECDAKLSEIGAAYDEAMQAANDEHMEIVQTRLRHLMGRAERLRNYAPNHAAVERTVSRIQEFVSLSQIGRASLGADESMHVMDINGPDKELGAAGGLQMGPPKQSGLGAVPKQLRHSTAGDALTAATHFTHQQHPAEQRFSQKADERIHQDWPALAGLFHDSGNGAIQPLAGTQRNVFRDPAVVDARRSVGRPQTRRPQQDDEGYRADARGIQGGFRMFKWPVRFSGAADAIPIDEFLFRVERLAQLDGVTTAALAIGIGVLLTDRASQWYWTGQRKQGHETWEELKQAFIRRYRPQRESDHDIRALIEGRKQRAGEHFGDFCQDIEALAVRLTRRMPEDELVEIMRRNMLMSLRKAMWRTPAESVDDLMQACGEFEVLCQEEERQMRAAQRRMGRVNEIDYGDADAEWLGGAEAATGYGGEQYVDAVQRGSGRADHMICWNCKDIGHLFSQCKIPLQSRFCFSCGMSGVLKSECPKCTGNVRRDQKTAGASRPAIAPAQPQIMMRPSNSSASNPFTSSNEAR